MGTWVKTKHKTIHMDLYSGGERSGKKARMNAREPLVNQIIGCIIISTFLIVYWLPNIVLHYHSPQPIQDTSYNNKTPQSPPFHLQNTYMPFPNTPLPPLPSTIATPTQFTHTPFPAGPMPPLSTSATIMTTTPFPRGNIPPLYNIIIPFPKLDST